MIQMQTSLAVADNSGAKRVEMIMPVGGSTSKIARLGDTDFVTIKSRDASQQFSLFGSEPQNGVSVASVQWSETVGKSTVILKKGTETAKLEFNEAELRGPAQGAAPPAGAAGGQPGRPQIGTMPPGANNAARTTPGVPPVGGKPQIVVTPAGANNAVRPPGVAPVIGTPQTPPGTPQAGENRRRVRVIGAPQ